MLDRSEKTLRIGGLIAVVLVGSAVVWWASDSLRRTGSLMGLSQPVVLAPHRAVYSLSLESAAALSNITAASGHMIIELQGAPCEGYTLNQRIVTDLTDADGRPSRRNSQFTSWESGSGDSFRFIYQHFRDGGLVEDIRGEAEQISASDGGVVNFTSPDGQVLEISRDTVFPTEHVIGLIKAARGNENQFVRTIFDGSNAEVLYHAAAYIGSALDAVSLGSEEPALPSDHQEVSQGLTAGQESWPILLSLFDADSQQSVPQYELAFRLYDNGISTDLHMDYGRFKLHGSLKAIEPLEASFCLGDG